MEAGGGGQVDGKGRQAGSPTRLGKSLLHRGRKTERREGRSERASGQRSVISPSLSRLPSLNFGTDRPTSDDVVVGGVGGDGLD